jgi:hypothetical protein
MAILAGCGGLSGSNASYYKAAVGATSDPTGTDCPGVPNPVVTFTGIDSDGTIAIYAQPNNQYLLDTGSGTGLTGTLTSGVYTFAGTDINDEQGGTQLTTTVKTTITLTPSGPGFTGLVTTEDICSGNGTTCGNGCGIADCSADGKDFDCVEQTSVLGTQVTGVEQQAPQAPGLPN